MDKVQKLISENKQIIKLIDLTETYKTNKTWENRSLYAVKISKNVETEQNLPNRLIISNHHARELMTPQIALDAIQRLVNEYKSNTTIQQIINENQI